jgi:hypothetical protein
MKNYTEKQYNPKSFDGGVNNEYIRILDSNNQLIDKFCQEHKYIYRYFPFERFLEVLHNKQLAFISPIKWNDPFDNFLFKHKIKNPFPFLIDYLSAVLLLIHIVKHIGRHMRPKGTRCVCNLKQKSCWVLF